jgi:hypothetical protein
MITWLPSLNTRPLVERLVTGQPAQSLSLKPTTAFGNFCLAHRQTKRGHGTKKRAARFSMSQWRSDGAAIPLAHSFDANCSSGRSSAKYASLMQADL